MNWRGYETDDLIVYTKNEDKEAKLLGQVKRSIRITGGDKVFGEVIQAAWSDFNNPEIFNKQFDAIALITGPLSNTDTYDVRDILEWARHSENSKEFLTNVELTNFSSKAKRRKLKVFRYHLKNANNGSDISDDKLWQFMKSFHILGYDLDIKAGVTLSLLQSHIGQYSQKDAPSLWAQLVSEVKSANQNAGTITLDSLPDDLRLAFQTKQPTTIPPDFIKTPEKIDTANYNKFQHAKELAIANLMGSWNEGNDADKALAEQLANEDYISWISKLREILLQADSPLRLKNGCWTISPRLEMWQGLGSHIFDEQLDKLKACAVNVFTKRDSLSKERYFAGICGEVFTCSNSLRKGLMESLALLGSYPKALDNCSLHKPETIAVFAVREILENADCVLWGSLNDLLPLLAEAAPGEFLNTVENALQKDPCPFSELFAQEGGRNYLTGLLWALETLAWDEQYLTRVTVILGDIAVLDPGGNWGNRPGNSLTTIFLPWFPQTIATVEKRKVAIQTLQREFPGIAWKVLLSLLPNQLLTSSGSHKPAWRETIPKDWDKGVNKREYWEQVFCYIDMAIEMAMGNLSRLHELIGHFDHLPQPAFDKLLEHLASNEITEKPEEERLPLWEALVKFIAGHRRFAGAHSAPDSDYIEKIERVAEALTPQNPLNRHRRLFSKRAIDLYEETGNWQEQAKKLEAHHRRAIQEIFASGGIQTVIRFAEIVEDAGIVGFYFGITADDDADSVILPALLETENTKLAQFTNSFILGKHQSRGWFWVDQIDISNWSIAQKAQFLAYLPFTGETWDRVGRLLDKRESVYWKKVNVNPYQAEGILETAVDKLVEYGRPNIAITCLCQMKYDKQPLDQTLVVKTLLAAASSTEPSCSMDVHDAIDLIKALQDDPNTDYDDLFQVEWAYLPLLDHYRNASPKLLEQRLASDPNFFCEVIRIIFRSKLKDKPDKEPGEQQKAIANNAYSLLHEWRMPPGMQSDGSYSADNFNQWLDSVKKTCSESGHLEVALSKVGNVMIHCPPDPDGLWIHHSAAEALNARDAESMREGFHSGIFNSRGIHWVDPTGKPEKELAAKYRQQASDVENKGYQRLAVTLRSLADSYDREAEDR